SRARPAPVQPARRRRAATRPPHQRGIDKVCKSLPSLNMSRIRKLFRGFATAFATSTFDSFGVPQVARLAGTAPGKGGYHESKLSKSRICLHLFSSFLEGVPAPRKRLRHNKMAVSGVIVTTNAYRSAFACSLQPHPCRRSNLCVQAKRLGYCGDL